MAAVRKTPSSGGGGRCPHCGFRAVEWEGYDTQEGDSSHQVCTQCGAVLTEGSFRAEPGLGCDVSLSALSVPAIASVSGSIPNQYLQRNAGLQQNPAGLSAGLLKIKEVCSFLKLPRYIEIEAGQGLRNCFYHEKIVSLRVVKKEILSACLVYLVCRQHDLVVTLTYISNFMACDVANMYKALKLAQDVLGVSFKTVDIETLAESELRRVKLDSLVDTVKSLLCLCGEAWLTTGRQPHALVHAACYIAWQADDFLSRRSVSLNVFLKKHQWKPSTTLSRRLGEMRQVLCRLAGELPWVTSATVEAKTVAIHLGDILKYQTALFRDSTQKVVRDTQSSLVGSGAGDPETEGAGDSNSAENGQVTTPFLPKSFLYNRELSFEDPDVSDEPGDGPDQAVKRNLDSVDLCSDDDPDDLDLIVVKPPPKKTKIVL